MSVLRKGKLATSVAGGSVVVTTVGKTLVELPSATGGATVLLDISGSTWTIPWVTSFQNAVFGITDAAWASAMPWFIYFINGTNAKAGVQLGMSRSPVYRFAPVEADFAYTDAACSGTDDQGIVAVSYVDGTDYNGKPMSLIGAVTMTYDATKWVPSLTISAANSGGCTEDALRDAFATSWTFPGGQNGAMTTVGGTNNYATHLMVTGGDLANDVPTWATNANIVYTYNLSSSGIVRIVHYTAGAGNCTNGDVAASLKLALPYDSYGVEALSGRVTLVANTTKYGDSELNLAAGSALGTFATVSTASSNANIYSNAGDDISAYGSYKAF